MYIRDLARNFLYNETRFTKQRKMDKRSKVMKNFYVIVIY